MEKSGHYRWHSFISSVLVAGSSLFSNRQPESENSKKTSHPIPQRQTNQRH
jgi:hypothetical protein